MLWLTLNMTSEREEVKGGKLSPLTSCWRGWMCLLDCCTVDCCWFPYGWWTKTPRWPAGRGNTNVSILLLFIWHDMHPLVLSLSVCVSWGFRAQTTYMDNNSNKIACQINPFPTVCLDVRCYQCTYILPCRWLQGHHQGDITGTPISEHLLALK